MSLLWDSTIRRAVRYSKTPGFVKMHVLQWLDIKEYRKVEKTVELSWQFGLLELWNRKAAYIPFICTSYYFFIMLYALLLCTNWICFSLF